VNESTGPLPLTVTVSVQPVWQWALQSQMSASWEMQAAMGTSSGSESDLIKSIILQTNPILLAVRGGGHMLGRGHPRWPPPPPPPVHRLLCWCVGATTRRGGEWGCVSFLPPAAVCV
jgi:hypothetical protein